MASELIEAAESQTESIATRQAYGDALVALGEAHPEVVALDADLAVSTQSMKFGKQFPERFFNIGAAEANMMSISTGLAASGKVPYASTFAIFATSRSYDQVRLGIAHNELKVRIGASHGGVSLGEDGASHQMIEDIALMRAMPKMQVVVPADYNQAYTAVIESYERFDGPMYMRFGRPKTPVVYEEIPETLGTGVDVLREGKDISIFVCGHMVWRGLEAAETLEREDGVEAEVVNVSIIKPIDSQSGAALARQDRCRRDGRGAPRGRWPRRRDPPGGLRAAPGPGLRARHAGRVRCLRHRRGVHGALRPHRQRHRRPGPRGPAQEADRAARAHPGRALVLASRRGHGQPATPDGSQRKLMPSRVRYPVCALIGTGPLADHECRRSSPGSRWARPAYRRPGRSPPGAGRSPPAG